MAFTAKTEHEQSGRNESEPMAYVEKPFSIQGSDGSDCHLLDSVGKLRKKFQRCPPSHRRYGGEQS